MLEKLVERAPRRQGPDRRRGALDRRRGRRPLPRRARRAAARRACPRRFLEADRRTRWRRWSAATPAPTARSRPRSSPSRYGVDPTPALQRAGARRRRWSAASCCRAAPSASGATPTSCAGCAAPASPALRKEVEAADPRELARFLPSWQNVDAHRRAGAGPDRLREALVPLQGVALTPEGLGARRAAAAARRLQPDLARRALHQRRARLDRRRRARAAATAASPSTSARTSASPARRRRTRSSSAPEGEIHDAIRERLAQRPVLLARPARRPRRARPRSCTTALWDLAWAGEVTNDAFAPLRAPRLRAVQRSRARRPPLRPPPRRAPAQAVAGPLVADRAAVRGRARRRARGCAPRPS